MAILVESIEAIVDCAAAIVSSGPTFCTKAEASVSCALAILSSSSQGLHSFEGVADSITGQVGQGAQGGVGVLTGVSFCVILVVGVSDPLTAVAVFVAVAVIVSQVLVAVCVTVAVHERVGVLVGVYEASGVFVGVECVAVGLGVFVGSTPSTL